MLVHEGNEREKPDNYKTGQPVFFYNYTPGADIYSWDCGDWNYSEFKDPVHSFQKTEKYKIKLIAVTSEGCRDSMIVTDIFNQIEPEIWFPSYSVPI